LREFTGYPNPVLEFPANELGLHPAAKPMGLLEFLIETYTRPSEIVLDSAMGIGSTGITAANTRRRFIGIEKDANFFRIAAHVETGICLTRDTVRVRRPMLMRCGRLERSGVTGLSRASLALPAPEAMLENSPFRPGDPILAT